MQITQRVPHSYPRHTIYTGVFSLALVISSTQREVHMTLVQALTSLDPFPGLPVGPRGTTEMEPKVPCLWVSQSTKVEPETVGSTNYKPGFQKVVCFYPHDPHSSLTGCQELLPIDLLHLWAGPIPCLLEAPRNQISTRQNGLEVTRLDDCHFHCKVGELPPARHTDRGARTSEVLYTHTHTHTHTPRQEKTNKASI